MSNNTTRIGKAGNSAIQIGRFTYGFENVSIMQWGEGAALEIGQCCSIASNVKIYLGGNHRLDWISTFPFGHIFVRELGGEHIQGHPATNGDVQIGSDVWIGAGVTIMSGVRIGHGAALAANSHVVRDVSPYHVVGGNPAKLIKVRFGAEIVERLLTLRWWDLDIQDIQSIVCTLCSPPSQESLDDLIKLHRDKNEKR